MAMSNEKPIDAFSGFSSVSCHFFRIDVMVFDKSNSLSTLSDFIGKMASKQ